MKQKWVKKLMNKKKGIDNLNKFFNSREEVINFFRDYIQMLSDTNYDEKQNETKGTGLKHQNKYFKDYQ